MRREVGGRRKDGFVSTAQDTDLTPLSKTSHGEIPVQCKTEHSRRYHTVAKNLNSSQRNSSHPLTICVTPDKSHNNLSQPPFLRLIQSTARRTDESVKHGERWAPSCAWPTPLVQAGGRAGRPSERTRGSLRGKAAVSSPRPPLWSLVRCKCFWAIIRPPTHALGRQSFLSGDGVRSAQGRARTGANAGAEPARSPDRPAGR